MTDSVTVGWKRRPPAQQHHEGYYSIAWQEVRKLLQSKTP